MYLFEIHTTVNVLGVVLMELSFAKHILSQMTSTEYHKSTYLTPSTNLITIYSYSVSGISSSLYQNKTKWTFCSHHFYPNEKCSCYFCNLIILSNQAHRLKINLKVKTNEKNKYHQN